MCRSMAQHCCRINKLIFSNKDHLPATRENQKRASIRVQSVQSNRIEKKAARASNNRERLALEEMKYLDYSFPIVSFQMGSLKLRHDKRVFESDQKTHRANKCRFSAGKTSCNSQRSHKVRHIRCTRSLLSHIRPSRQSKPFHLDTGQSSVASFSI